MPLSSWYIIRVDDVHEQMDKNRFLDLKQLLLTYRIRPLVGVIPQWKLHDSSNALKWPHFWEQMCECQRALGWTVAMHGFTHEPHTRQPGLLGICRASEFAGLPYHVQREFLERGKEVLETNGIETDIFMAPWHSFDINTLRALRDCGFRWITDRYGIAPRKRLRGIRIGVVPQQFEKPRRMPVGLWTFAIHPDGLHKSGLERMEKFFEAHGKDCVAFGTAVGYRLPWYLRPGDVGFRAVLRAYRWYRLRRGYCDAV